MKFGKLGSLLSRKKNAGTPTVSNEPEIIAQTVDVKETSELIEQPPEELPVAEENETVQSRQDMQDTSYRGNEKTEQELNMEDDDERIVVADFSKQQLALSEQRLIEFTRNCAGVYGAIISTVDGHSVAQALKRDIPANKISTMTSSLLALGESIARESEQRFCQFVILDNSNGRVVSLRINDILMLTCISTKDSNLGMLLSNGRSTADALSELLR
ncbi:MAG: hypothetical protein HC808_01980 [Candidatus Competibacteraceae bacterium]|nr:hypothetical protein [Candidatus Competibacteraceae bacterium]